MTHTSCRGKNFLLLTLLPSLISCASNDWKQFHGGATNAGYMNVSNGTQLTPKWQKPLPLGSVSYSSPAIASDGTIYVGTTTGALVAVYGDGSGIKWSFQSNGMFANPTIVSSPAIGQDGDIYFTLVQLAIPTQIPQFGTVLMKIGADGTFKNSFQFAQTNGFGYPYTTASPKLLDYNGGEYIFIVSRGSLFVFDKSLNAIAQHRINCSGDLTEPTLPGTWDFDLLDPQHYYGVQGGGHFFDVFQNPTTGYWIDPTVAVITNVNGQDLASPMVAAPLNHCGLEGFSFTPPPNAALAPKWFAPRTNEELLSSPAISDDGEVVIGSSSGWLFSYDVVSGNGKWIYNTHEPMMATPAFFIGIDPLFAAGLNNLYTINGGSVYAKVALPGATEASPAATKGAFVVSTQAGVISANSNLTQVTTNALILGGMSSPAIGGDGTIYVVSSTGALMAYSGN